MRGAALKGSVKVSFPLFDIEISELPLTIFYLVCRLDGRFVLRVSDALSARKSISNYLEWPMITRVRAYARIPEGYVRYAGLTCLCGYAFA